MFNRKLTSAAAILLFLLPACSLPRVVVLHDPLSAEEHLRLAGIYDAQEKPELAREQYEAAVNSDPRHARAWSLLGDFSFRTRDYKTAQKAYEKAISLEPAKGDLYNNLAWVHLQSPEQAEKARELAGKALSLTPDHRPYYLDTLGVALLKLGKTAEAITAIRESIATLPANKPELAAEAYEHLAEACRAVHDAPCTTDAENRAQELHNLR